MSRLLQLLVLLTSLFAVVSSSAGAVTWHNTGSTVFTATGGPATFSVGSNNLSCTASSVTGTAPGGTTVSPDYDIVATIGYSPCTVVGQSAKVHCSVDLTGVSLPLHLKLILKIRGCKVTLGSVPSTPICDIHGTVPGVYTNPSGTTAGRIHTSTASTLTTTDATTPCPLGTGTTTLSAQTITITSGSPTSLGPIINRTA